MHQVPRLRTKVDRGFHGRVQDWPKVRISKTARTPIAKAIWGIRIDQIPSLLSPLGGRGAVIVWPTCTSHLRVKIDRKLAKHLCQIAFADALLVRPTWVALTAVRVVLVEGARAWSHASMSSQKDNLNANKSFFEDNCIYGWCCAVHIQLNWTQKSFTRSWGWSQNRQTLNHNLSGPYGELWSVLQLTNVIGPHGLHLLLTYFRSPLSTTESTQFRRPGHNATARKNNKSWSDQKQKQPWKEGHVWSLHAMAWGSGQMAKLLVHRRHHRRRQRPPAGGAAPQPTIHLRFEFRHAKI